MLVHTFTENDIEPLFQLFAHQLTINSFTTAEFVEFVCDITGHSASVNEPFDLIQFIDVEFQDDQDLIVFKLKWL